MLKLLVGLLTVFLLQTSAHAADKSQNQYL